MPDAARKLLPVAMSGLEQQAADSLSHRPAPLDGPLAAASHGPSRVRTSNRSNSLAVRLRAGAPPRLLHLPVRPVLPGTPESAARLQDQVLLELRKRGARVAPGPART